MGHFNGLLLNNAQKDKILKFKELMKELEMHEICNSEEASWLLSDSTANLEENLSCFQQRGILEIVDI